VGGWGADRTANFCKEMVECGQTLGRGGLWGEANGREWGDPIGLAGGEAVGGESNSGCSAGGGTKTRNQPRKGS